MVVGELLLAEAPPDFVWSPLDVLRSSLEPPTSDSGPQLLRLSFYYLRLKLQLFPLSSVVLLRVVVQDIVQYVYAYVEVDHDLSDAPQSLLDAFGAVFLSGVDTLS